MPDRALVVRTEELTPIVGKWRFMALPREEIERLHASIEVVAMDRELAGRDQAWTQLVTYTAVHHNYTWLTYSREGAWSLGIGGPIEAAERIPLFLDDELEVAARSVIDEQIVTRDAYDLRLVGLMNAQGSGAGPRELGLVHVARLRQPGVEWRGRVLGTVRFRGSGELLHERDQFDTSSQILIDNLHAL